MSADLLVLDEINSCAALHIICEEAVLDLIAKKPTTTELILTGRGAPESWKQHADLVTDMQLVKHYFYKGMCARAGMDY